MKTNKILAFLVIAFLGLFVPGCEKDDEGSIIQPPGATLFYYETDLQSWFAEGTTLNLVHNSVKDSVLHGEKSV
jgi:hypothetical protein